MSTPDAMRGRVSAINGIFIGSSNELGSFESGIAARLMGLVPSVVFGGLMTPEQTAHNIKWLDALQAQLKIRSPQPISLLFNVKK